MLILKKEEKSEMRNLEVRPKAIESITDVADFIELINTPGSSDKWANKVHDFLQELANSSIKSFPLCNNTKRARLRFSCRTYNKKWIVVFRYTTTTLTVHRFVLGAKLK